MRQGQNLRQTDFLKFWFRHFINFGFDPKALTSQKLSRAKAPGWRFFALVWEGHLLDLLGRRTDAVAAYQEAQKAPGTPSMRHDQYGLVIDKKWVEERLKTPFERR